MRGLRTRLAAVFPLSSNSATSTATPTRLTRCISPFPTIATCMQKTRRGCDDLARQEDISKGPARDPLKARRAGCSRRHRASVYQKNLRDGCRKRPREPSSMTPPRHRALTRNAKSDSRALAMSAFIARTNGSLSVTLWSRFAPSWVCSFREFP